MVLRNTWWNLDGFLSSNDLFNEMLDLEFGFSVIVEKEEGIEVQDFEQRLVCMYIIYTDFSHKLEEVVIKKIVKTYCQIFI